MKSQKLALTRFQFDMPEQSIQRLQAIKAKTEAVTYAEVVKNALRIYEALIAQEESGNKFLISDTHGNIHRYDIF